MIDNDLEYLEEFCEFHKVNKLIKVRDKNTGKFKIICKSCGENFNKIKKEKFKQTTLFKVNVSKI